MKSTNPVWNLLTLYEKQYKRLRRPVWVIQGRPRIFAMVFSIFHFLKALLINEGETIRGERESGRNDPYSLWIVHSWLHHRFSLTFIFILPVLQVSLDCPFLIAPSVFSNVYFHPVGVTSVSGLSILDCTFGFLYRLFSSCRCYKCLWIVHSWLHLRFSLTFIFILPVLQVSLDCPFFDCTFGFP